MKRISILGSTGSIGRATLEVASHLSPDAIQVVSLAVKSNIALLEAQVKKYRPEKVAVYDKDKALELQKRIPHTPVLAGLEGICALTEESTVDMVVSAMAGTLGLAPTVSALSAGKQVALANKEALVSGGALIMALAKKNRVEILPIDSEHSAIFQCLNGENKKNVSRLILTSSGGPFREYSEECLEKITLEQALNHPTWTMGKKVTIDSSTLMNKGLEVIEAHWLFDIPLSQIDVVIHPQSVIHSMVEFVDGSMMAQMSRPTMIVPIQYALTYPDRKPGLIEPFDFLAHQKLEFFSPDKKKFRCLSLAYQAVKEGQSMPCYMNAANEVLVERFIDRQISWIDISSKLETLMQRHEKREAASLEDLYQIDAEGRREAAEI